MKKQIIIAAATLGTIVFGTTAVKAQETAKAKSAEATANVKITIADMISIESGATAAGGEVEFNYSNREDYKKDQTVEKQNSLIFASSKTFDVEVSANATDFVGTTATNKIPVSVMKIKAVNGDKMDGTLAEIVLSTEKQSLVTNETPGLGKSLTIQYTIPSDKAEQDLLGKPTDTYSQIVTYTATAKP